MFDPVLGQLLKGSQIDTIPPNASKDQQTAAINEMIETLNNFSRDVVLTDTLQFQTDGLEETIVITIPHNLGYTPRAYVYLNDVTITVNGSPIPHCTFPLPTYLSEQGAFVGGGGGTPQVIFGSYLDYFIDATNLYIHLNNPNEDAFDLPITYVLYRSPAN